MHKIWILITLTFFFMVTSNQVLAKTDDELYTEINLEGDYVDGNQSLIKYDKPVIRPGYLGSSIIDDYIGPKGKFQGYFGEPPWPETSPDYFGQEFSIGKGVIVRNVGFHNGKKIAISIAFGLKLPVWSRKVSVTREGALNINPDSQGIEFRLVYDDGEYKTPVPNVYVELPVLSEPSSYSSFFSSTNIKSSNLIRLFFNTDINQQIENEVSRDNTLFRDNKGNYYTADTLNIKYKFYTDKPRVNPIEQTFIFDNNEPLVFTENLSRSLSQVTSLFKSTMKTPGEISYLPPRTNGTVNSDKFEANFDLTQAITDGYDQYYPNSVGIVMSDNEHIFNSLNISKIRFTDKKGNDISTYMKINRIDNHKLEFTIEKENLMSLKSNQINISLSADQLNSEEVLKNYDEKEQAYIIPMTFYNYKIFKSVKTESEKMTAMAKITPSIYGEAEEGVRADQYTYSGDLDKENLLKNVATTIPNDALIIDMLDKNIYFNQVKPYEVQMKISSKITGKSKIVAVPVTIIKAEPVTEDYFENQRWLIEEINRQFLSQNKKIGVNLYMADLLKITRIINTNSNEKFTGQHIPKTIAALKNLEIFELWSKKLVGSLPEELGELKQLRKLSLFGNEFMGEIPYQIGELNSLQQLILDNNQLTGKIPSTIRKLSKLLEINLSNNKLVGEIVVFPPKQLSEYNVSMNQVTYNEVNPPDFVPKLTNYGNTLIVKKHNIGGTAYAMWKLSSKKEVSVEKNNMIIKPFDPKDIGFFDLKIESTSSSSKAELYSGHSFTIMNKKTGEIVYEGGLNSDVKIKVNMNDSYVVIMDGADKNPNNQVEIVCKLRELKIVQAPKKVSLALEAGDLGYEPVTITSKDSLIIFDNRLNNHWKLRLKPTELTNIADSIVGTYYYQNAKNEFVEIPANSYKVIEQGSSNPDSEFIDISSSWSNNKGLKFKQKSTANRKGSYNGLLEWQLVDAPIP